jgi:hypothetical protein
MSCDGYYLDCQCDECINRETPSTAKDDRIAELTAEVNEVRELNRKLGLNNDKLRADMQAITGRFIRMEGTSYETAADMHDIARNALKHGL